MTTAALVSVLAANAYAAWRLTGTPGGLGPIGLSLLLLVTALHAWQTACLPKRTIWLLPAVLVLLLIPAALTAPIFSMLLSIPLYQLISQGVLFSRRKKIILRQNSISPAKALAVFPPDGRMKAPQVLVWLAVGLPLLTGPAASWPDTLVVGGLQLLVHLLSMEMVQEKKRLTETIDQLRGDLQDIARRQTQDGAFQRQLTDNAHLEERNRLAQTLHDRIGHTISASLMQLEAIRTLIPIHPDKTLPMLDTVLSTLRSGLDAIRETLRNLKPAQEELGVNRIRLLLDDFSAKNGISTHFTCSGDLQRISPAAWKTLLDNTGEALTNIVRHAHRDRPALTVAVDVSVLNKVLRASVQDNGPGCALIKKGLGLQGIEERLASQDGRLILDGSKGFSLIMLIPLDHTL